MIALATLGVKNRSRKLRAMSAVGTSGAPWIGVLPAGGLRTRHSDAANTRISHGRGHPQKLLITAVKTWLIVAGLLAL